ncbi:MAG: heparin lyase I family protein [Pseudomonadota bacterium]
MRFLKQLATGVAFSLLAGCMTTVPNEVSRTGASVDLAAYEPPKGYARLFSPAVHSYRPGLVSVGDPVRRGARSERFELRGEDCGGSDCNEPRARAEIQMTPSETTAALGEDIWYGWSFYNATVPNFSRDTSLRLVFGQWTMGGKHRPIFRLIQLGKDEGDFSACADTICRGANLGQGDVVLQLEDIAEALNWGDAQNNGYVCRLFDMQAQRGQWVDLTLNTNFSTRGDGYVRVWVNGNLACDYQGPVVSATSAASGLPPRHRRGVFSSWTKRWEKANGSARKPTMIVYYDEFRAGKTRADVDVRQRAQAGQGPTD